MLYIIVSTYRDSLQVIATLSYLISIASEDIHIIISDCSGSQSKMAFIKNIEQQNPFVSVLINDNRVPLYKDISSIIIEKTAPDSFISIVGDDDIFSLDYIIHSADLLQKNIGAVCSYGNYIVCQTNQNIFIDSRNALENIATERIKKGFNPNYFNTMFFAIFRHSALMPWANFTQNHPIPAVFFDFIHNLSLMAQGKIMTHHHGHYLWTGENWDTPEKNQQSRIRHYQTIGIHENFHLFHDLHFAVECANFLLGKYSPVTDSSEKEACAQIAWERCIERFRPMVQQNEGLFVHILSPHPKAVESLKQLYHLTHCNHSQRTAWFANIVEVFSADIANRYRLFFQ